MVICATRISCGAFNPSHRFDRKTGSMRLRGCDFYLIEFELDGSLTAKHGNHHADTVRILDGPLSSFTGVVENLEVDKNSVSVIVSMFGRETPVEFELDQVELISQ